MRKYFSGQALIVVLLIMIVALTVGLSISTRTIRDVRVSTRTEESQRAFSAAEAGLEAALLSGGSSLTVAVDTDVSYKYTCRDAGNDTYFVYPEKIARDDVQQIWLIGHDAAGGLIEDGSGYQGGAIIVGWGNDGMVASDIKPALEVSLVYKKVGTYMIQKWAYDPDSSRQGNNKFLNPGGGTETFGNTKFAFSQTITFPPLALNSNNQYTLLRLRLLYSDKKHSLGVSSGNANKIPKQGQICDSIGTTAVAGSTQQESRVLSAFKSYPYLPGIFDFVLFSQSDLSKPAIP